MVVLAECKEMTLLDHREEVFLEEEGVVDILRILVPQHQEVMEDLGLEEEDPVLQKQQSLREKVAMAASGVEEEEVVKIPEQEELAKVAMEALAVVAAELEMVPINPDLSLD